jgi:hypothetical protein
LRRTLALLTFVLLSARLASAQDVGGATTTDPNDAPNIRVGGTIFNDFVYQSAPAITDTDGNTVKLSQFNVSRAYINVVGQISHLISFRITPDITREGGVTNNLNGSLVFRLKYTYAQLNLDDWLTKGSYAQFGIQKTPWVAFYEDIYRYRFQGTTFTERETSPTGTNINSSADAAVSFRYMFPRNFGDIHVGVYNGEFYFKPEVNNMKSYQARISVRPFAQMGPALSGLRAHIYYNGDHYVQDAERKRVVGSVTYEGDYLHGGFDYLAAKDQQSITKFDQSGKGWSAWFTPRSSIGLEALLRWDHFTPLDSCTTPSTATTACPSTILANGVPVTPNSQVRKRTILGVAYWFPHKSDARVGSAILVDYDDYKFDNFDAKANPEQKKIEAHWLVNW